MSSECSPIEFHPYRADQNLAYVPGASYEPSFLLECYRLGALTINPGRLVEARENLIQAGLSDFEACYLRTRQYIDNICFSNMAATISGQNRLHSFELDRAIYHHELNLRRRQLETLYGLDSDPVVLLAIKIALQKGDFKDAPVQVDPRPTALTQAIRLILGEFLHVS